MELDADLCRDRTWPRFKDAELFALAVQLDDVPVLYRDALHQRCDVAACDAHDIFLGPQ